MSESSGDHYPISDDLTREISAGGESNETLGFEGLEEDRADEAESLPSQIGDYVILKQIGAGGMGQVFLAEHVRMQRIVAVKTLQFNRMQDEAAISRFYDEVRAASRLMHPNIVTAFDAGEANSIHYLAMEYVDGATLTQWVARRGPMQIGEAASAIRQAALGLLHAHRAGIIHRDVKPGNLMRAADGTIKVLDLGLAQFAKPLFSDEQEPIDQAGSAESGPPRRRLIGTLAYMSPEQLESPDDADARSDIYSLGAVLYFLLVAKPPYTGEYLDVVYGHRHGEVPDLMELRDDVDLHFANIFSRMMAKSPDARYASLDEVIDELAEYTDASNAPLWLAEFTRRQGRDEVSTASVGSTTMSESQVLAIDLGMFYSATAEASGTGGVNVVSAGGSGQMLLRMAVASDGDRMVLAREATERRLTDPSSVVHCLPMYIGKDDVDRVIAGRKCPPEVLLAALLREAVRNSWSEGRSPEAAAITIPGVYDQLHRMSILQAAEMAGLRSVRLVDRSVAAIQSLLLDTPQDTLDSEDVALVDTAVEQNILFVGVTGQASEVSVVRRNGLRLQQMSTAGHWHTGTLAWLRHLVQLASERFKDSHGVDPRQSLRTASGLQVACERAMNSLLLLPRVTITVNFGKEPLSVSISRREWLARAKDLVDGIRRSIDEALQRASVTVDEIDRCVTMGPLLQLDEVRKGLVQVVDDRCDIQIVDRSDAARGAAACLAGELPGRATLALPPRCVTSQSIGIVVEDKKGRRRILPIIPQGTSLPARTNRRLTVGKKRSSMTLSLVESSGSHRDDWQSLGRYVFEVNDQPQGAAARTRMIGFEVNVNGMLSIRAQSPGTPGSTRLATLPTPKLSSEEVAKWTKWLDKMF